MYQNNNNIYAGYMPRQQYPQPVYPQGYSGAYPPYMAAQPGQIPQEPPISDVRFLTSDEMKAFIVMPNMKVLLIDKDHGVACVKSADATGQSTIKMYSFKDTTTPEKTKEEIPSYDKEIKSLTARVDRLEKNAKKSE